MVKLHQQIFKELNLHIKGEHTMPNQIERLQAQFYSLDLDQKREFIKNLQDEMHYSSDPEWRLYIQPFISKCIREYNDEINRLAGPPPAPELL